jgi:hypothetical protein
MNENGSAKKLLAVGLVVGILFVAIRAVRGGDEAATDTEETDSIDRVDTGGNRNEDPVDTGLDRVDTADSETDDAETAEESDNGTEDETNETSETADTTPTGATSMDAGFLESRRLETLDVFDYLAILGAAFEAAKREYDARV